MSRSPRPTPALRIEFRWDMVNKRWLVESVLQMPVGVSSHRQWVETSEPMDALNAARLCGAIKAEMESWLPFHGPSWAEED